MFATLLHGLPRSARGALFGLSFSALAPFASAGPEVPILQFGAGQLSDPLDVAVFAPCGAGPRAFVADAGLHQVVRYLFSSTNAVSPPFAFGSFVNGPFGIAVNDQPDHPGFGEIYVSDSDGAGNGMVLVYQAGGGLERIFYGQASAPFQQPLGIAIDGSGDIYVADKGLAQAQKFSWASTLASTANPVHSYTLLSQPVDVSVDSSGRVHVLDASWDSVITFANDPVANTNLGVHSQLNMTGLDVLDPLGDLRLTAREDVDRLTWDFSPFWVFNYLSSYQIHSWVPQPPADLGGLEFQRLFRYTTSFLSPLDRETRCERRVWVANRQHARIDVYGELLDSANRPADMVAFWPFDESVSSTAKELIAGHDGSHAGLGVDPKPGKVRCAAGFDGGTSWISVPDDDALDFGTGDFTIEFWIRAQLETGVVTLLDKRLGVGAGYSLFLLNGYVGLQTNNGTNWVNYAPTAAGNFVAEGRWHHVAVVCDRGLATRLYVDGTLVGSDVASATLPGSLDNSAPLFIGRHNSSTNAGLNGDLDELSFYTRALSEAEIDSIVDAACAGKDQPAAQTISTLPADVLSGGAAVLRVGAGGSGAAGGSSTTGAAGVGGKGL